MGRVLGLVLLMVATGLAGGYAVAELSEEGPRTLTGQASPLPAEPSVPTPSAVEVLPDPDTPPLAVNLPTKRTRLSTGRSGYVLHVDQPVGWRRHRSEATWTWAVPTNPLNTYRLRVVILAGSNHSVSVAKNTRINAFEEAEADGNLSDFNVESQTADTFIATYIDDGYLRVTMERIVAFEGESAYAAAAVTGREEDRPGLTDLVQRVANSMEPG